MQPIQLQPEHDKAIRAHGVDAFPHECCGFLLGYDADDVRRIVRVTEAVNRRGAPEKHNRFTISPEAFLQAEKTARAEKLDVLGFYHSHPNAPARPSQYDVDHAWPVYSYIIVSVRDGVPEAMTSWVLQEDRSGFDPQPIAIAE
jgi:proteasome lid subunit RPN8/RPN11